MGKRVLLWTMALGPPGCTPGNPRGHEVLRSVPAAGSDRRKSYGITPFNGRMRFYVSNDIGIPAHRPCSANASSMQFTGSHADTVQSECNRDAKALI